MKNTLKRKVLVSGICLVFAYPILAAMITNAFSFMQPPTCAQSCPNPFPSGSLTPTASPTAAFCGLMDCILDHCNATDLGGQANRDLFQASYTTSCP